MEYIGKCPKCGKHNIVASKRRINPKLTAIHRYGRCVTCKTAKKHTIIGEIVHLARLMNRNTIAIRFW